MGYYQFGLIRIAELTPFGPGVLTLFMAVDIGMFHAWPRLQAQN